MGILNFYHGIESLGPSLGFLPPIVTRNHDTFLFLELVRKPRLMTYGVKSYGYCGNGKFRRLVHTFILFLDSVV